MICTPHRIRILFRSSQEGYNARDMSQAWGRGKMHTGVWLGKLRNKTSWKTRCNKEDEVKMNVTTVEGECSVCFRLAQDSGL